MRWDLLPFSSYGQYALLAEAVAHTWASPSVKIHLSGRVQKIVRGKSACLLVLLILVVSALTSKGAWKSRLIVSLRSFCQLQT